MPVIFSGAVTVSPNLITYVGQDDGDQANPEGARAPTPWTQSDAARASFLGRLTSPVTNTFDTGFVDDQSLPITVSFGAAGDATLSATGSAFVNEIPTGTNGAGRYPTSGDFYIDTRVGFTVEFSRTDISGFGFRGTDVGDFNGQLKLIFTFSDLTTQTWNVPHMLGVAGQYPAAGSVLFVGVVTTQPFSKVEFDNTSGGFDIFGFDDFTAVTTAQTQMGRVPRLSPWDPRYEIMRRFYRVEWHRVMLNGIETEAWTLVPGIEFKATLKG